MRVVWIGRIEIRTAIKRIRDRTCCDQEDDGENYEKTGRDETQRSLLSCHLAAVRTSAEAEQSVGIPPVMLVLFV